jgi:hypothetical protein
MLILLLLLQNAGSILIAAFSGLVIGAFGGSALRSDNSSRFMAVFWITTVASLVLQGLCCIVVGAANQSDVGFQELAGVVILQLLVLAVAFHLIRRAARRNASVALMSLHGVVSVPIGFLLSGVVQLLLGLLFVIYCMSGATCHW